MNPAPFIAAEKRHALSVGVPGTLQIGTTRYPARIYVERTTNYQSEGGTLQTRKLSALILCSLLPASAILTAGGDTRAQPVLHVETNTQYRIDPGGIDRSPYAVFWSLECSQETAQ